MSEIEEALALIAQQAGRPPPAAVRAHPFAYQTSSPLEEVELTRSDGTVERLIAKRIGWEALSDDARLAKPRWLFDPRREAAVYEHILPSAEPGPPRLYGWVERRRGECLLFIERVEGSVLWQVGDRATWEEAARWLARSQARLHEGGVPASGADRLIEYDEPYLRRWPELALARARNGDHPDEQVQRLERIAQRHAEVVATLLPLPVSILHGEFFPSNILVGKRAGGVRIAPIDWELAGRGPALIDLAALTLGSWSEGEPPGLAAAYRDGLPAGHPLAPGDEAFDRGLAACRLHLAMRALGSPSAGWSPPPQHRHDWLGEALAAADSLGL